MRGSAGDKKFKGVISLVGTRLVDDGDAGASGGRPNVFSLATPKKSYHIQAATESEKVAWLAALSHNMALCSRVPASRRDLLKYATALVLVIPSHGSH